MSQRRRLKKNTITSSIEESYIVKLLLLGESRSGKSALLQRYVNDSFSERYIRTYFSDFESMTLELGELCGHVKAQVQIFDMRGQLNFDNEIKRINSQTIFLLLMV